MYCYLRLIPHLSTFELDLSEQAGDLHGVDGRPLGPGLHHQLQVVLGELLDEAARDARRVDVVRRRRKLLLVRAIHLGTFARDLSRESRFVLTFKRLLLCSAQRARANSKSTGYHGDPV